MKKLWKQVLSLGLVAVLSCSSLPFGLGSGIAYAAQENAKSNHLDEILKKQSSGPYDLLLLIRQDKNADDMSAQKAAAVAQNDIKEMLDRALEQGKVSSYESFFSSNSIHVIASDIDFIRQLAAHPSVEDIALNGKVSAVDTSSSSSAQNGGDVIDSADGIDWGVKMVRANSVWDEFHLDGSGVTIGIIDTGVNYKLPVLRNAYKGYDAATGTYDTKYYKDFIDPDKVEPAASSENTHGTHVAGTILGKEGDSLNRIGVAPGAKFINARAISEGMTSSDVILRAGDWMYSMHPDIINNSWAGASNNNDEWFARMAQTWQDAGIIAVFAAGNAENTDSESGLGTIANPANLLDVIAVGAVDKKKKIAPFSEKGPSVFDPSGNVTKPEISAPGVSIRSLNAMGEYVNDSGTSMAAPHVSGVLALLKQADPSLTPQRAKEILEKTAEPLTDEKFSQSPNMAYGYGLVNAYDAVASLRGREQGSIYGKVTKGGERNMSAYEEVEVSPAQTTQAQTTQTTQEQSESSHSGESVSAARVATPADATDEAKENESKEETSTAAMVKKQSINRNIAFKPLIKVLDTGAYAYAKSDGSYKIPHAVNQAGSPYTVEVSAYGYITQTAQVDLSSQSNQKVDFVLQPAQIAKVSGKVLDETGNALSGVNVKVVEDENVDNVQTNEDGSYRIQAAYEGNYTLRFSKYGYLSKTMKLRLNAGENTLKNVTLFQLSNLEEYSQNNGVGDVDGANVEAVMTGGQEQGVAVKFVTPVDGGILKSANLYLVNSGDYRGNHIQVGVVGYDSGRRLRELIPFRDVENAHSGWNSVDFSDYYLKTSDPIYVAVRYAKPIGESIGVAYDENASENNKNQSYLFNGELSPVSERSSLSEGGFAITTKWYSGTTSGNATDVEEPNVENLPQVSVPETHSRTHSQTPTQSTQSETLPQKDYRQKSDGSGVKAPVGTETSRSGKIYGWEDQAKNMHGHLVASDTVDRKWQRNGNHWQLLRSNGEPYKNTWVKAYTTSQTKQGTHFSWFRFDSDGNMQTGWVKDEKGHWFYLEGSQDQYAGELVVGWRKIGDDWYYFNTSAPKVEGRMETGLFVDKNKDTYYLHEGKDKNEGKMAKGWTLIKDQWIYFNDSGKKVARAFDDEFLRAQDAQENSNS